MIRRARRNHSPAFKEKVTLAALLDDKTITQIAEEFDVHQNQITDWKQQLENRSAELFGKTTEPEVSTVDIKTLYAKIGQLTLKNYFLGGESLFLRKIFPGSCSKNQQKITRPPMPSAAPIRPRHLVSTQQGVET